MWTNAATILLNVDQCCIYLVENMEGFVLPVFGFVGGHPPASVVHWCETNSADHIAMYVIESLSKLYIGLSPTAVNDWVL